LSPATLAIPLELSIPDHELLQRIGQGSYGEVWLARNRVGTLRAVKIVWRKTFWHDHPFEREFKGIQKFEPISRSHDGLVDILHIGRGDGYFYYVMELADEANVECRMTNVEPTLTRPADTLSHPMGEGRGEGTSSFVIHHSDLYTPRTLATDVGRHRRLPPAECVRIGLALTSALAHLHRHKLVHRDVKPFNAKRTGGKFLASAAVFAAMAGASGHRPPQRRAHPRLRHSPAPSNREI
jgi:serine/threonine protein kinase